MSSPWALSLSSALRVLLKERKATEMDEYSSALRAQVRVCGLDLLRQFEGGNEGQIEAVSAHIDRAVSRGITPCRVMPSN